MGMGGWIWWWHSPTTRQVAAQSAGATRLAVKLEGGPGNPQCVGAVIRALTAAGPGGRKSSQLVPVLVTELGHTSGEQCITHHVTCKCAGRMARPKNGQSRLAPKL